VARTHTPPSLMVVRGAPRLRGTSVGPFGAVGALSVDMAMALMDWVTLAAATAAISGMVLVLSAPVPCCPDLRPFSSGNVVLAGCRQLP
jgi:hypothetical protein